MGQYKAALVDLDGTLIDRVAAFGRVAGALHDEELAIQAVISRDDFVELMVVWDEDGNAPREDVYGLILQYWPGVTRSLQELLAFHNRTQPISTLPDERVVAFLRELHATGMPWGEVGYEKPDPRIYQDGLKQLGGISAADTLFVGDNVETDIGGAQSAGMPTAWVKRGREWPAANQPPDYQIDHVDELRAMLL